jgi:hypothetical protein
MSETLGKIEKPSAADYKGGRKIFFVPLVFRGKESPSGYVERYDSYWQPVESQLADLESKLGKVNRVYHELIPAGGESGLKVLKELHQKTYVIAKSRVDNGAQLEATEESDMLSEFLDWGRCLAIGLQNQRVFVTVYESYVQAGKKRNEYIARRINETLQADEIGVLFMREGHQLQFPADVQVFYISPPQLDELRRWLRDHEAESQQG